MFSVLPSSSFSFSFSFFFTEFGDLGFFFFSLSTFTGFKFLDTEKKKAAPSDRFGVYK